ncbi:MAG: hypothetical protein ACHP7N_06915 [Caulobacterales bacterium]
MNTLPALLEWLKEQRNLFQENLERLDNGTLTTKHERDGRMVDTSKETATDYRRSLERVTGLIAVVERDLAQGS